MVKQKKEQALSQNIYIFRPIYNKEICKHCLANFLMENNNIYNVIYEIIIN